MKLTVRAVGKDRCPFCDGLGVKTGKYKFDNNGNCYRNITCASCNKVSKEYYSLIYTITIGYKEE